MYVHTCNHFGNWLPEVLTIVLGEAFFYFVNQIKNFIGDIIICMGVEKYSECFIRI